MAEYVEKTGKTVEEAVEAALSELAVDRDSVTYEILEEPSKGFLGIIGGKQAKVRVTVKEVSAEDKADKFLHEIFAAMQLEVGIDKEERDGYHIYNLNGENMGILIGKHGQTLDALQYLTNLAANHGENEEKIRIVLDIEDYRRRREDTLKHLATRLADKARRTKQKIVLEPMNRHERKVIHMALQNSRGIMTYSAGDEPFRKVVIEPKTAEM